MPMPSPTDDDIRQLATALHRKLKNYGEDIRKASRVPTAQRDAVHLKALKRDRTFVDQAYSRSAKLLASTDHEERVKHYSDLKAIYNKL